MFVSVCSIALDFWCSYALLSFMRTWLLTASEFSCYLSFLFLSFAVTNVALCSHLILSTHFRNLMCRRIYKDFENAVCSKVIKNKFIQSTIYLTPGRTLEQKVISKNILSNIYCIWARIVRSTRETIEC